MRPFAKKQQNNRLVTKTQTARPVLMPHLFLHTFRKQFRFMPATCDNITFFVGFRQQALGGRATAFLAAGRGCYDGRAQEYKKN